MSEPLVIIGNGMAAARLADELSKRALGRYAVAVIGAEPRLAYNRVLLSSVLAGEVPSSDIELKPTALVARPRYHAALRLRRDRNRHGGAQRDARGRRAPALLQAGVRDRLAADPARDPRHGSAGRHHVSRRRRRLERSGIAPARVTRVVVIGGGLLGLEAAYGLAKAGARVTLVHLMDRLMERQLDSRAARMLQRAVEAKGIKVILKADTAGIGGSGSVESVTLKDGRTIEADAVVVAIGIRPNADLAREAGIARQARHRGRRRAGDQRARHPRDRRMRRASRHLSTDWSSPPTSRRACWPHCLTGRTARLRRQRARHQPEGLRRQCVLGRRLSRRRMAPKRSS